MTGVFAYIDHTKKESLSVGKYTSRGVNFAIYIYVYVYICVCKTYIYIYIRIIQVS